MLGSREVNDGVGAFLGPQYFGPPIKCVAKSFGSTATLPEEIKEVPRKCECMSREDAALAAAAGLDPDARTGDVKQEMAEIVDAQHERPGHGTTLVIILLGASVVVLVLVVVCLVMNGTKKLSEDRLHEEIDALGEEEEKLVAKLEELRVDKDKREEQAWLLGHPEESSSKGLNLAVDEYVKVRTAASLHKVRDVLHRKDVIEGMLNHRVEEESARMKHSLMDSAASFVGDFRSILEMDDEKLSEMNSSVSGKNLPPLALVVAGLAAPLQLFALVTVNRIFLLWHLIITVTDVVVLAFPRDRECETSISARVFEWLIVHSVVHVIGFSLRLWAEVTVSATHRRIASRKVSHDDVLGSIGFVGLLLKADMDNPRALYLLDYMASSWVFACATATLVADFVWNLVAGCTVFLDHYSVLQEYKSLHPSCLQKGGGRGFTLMRVYNVLSSPPPRDPLHESVVEGASPDTNLQCKSV
jgi:hypothetical protein